MVPIKNSGFFIPNRIAYFTIIALDDIIGLNGLKTVLNVAGLPEYIESFPPDDLDRQFDFADFSAINASMADLFGSRGSRSLAQRIGRVAFNNGLKNYGAMAGAGDPAFQSLPLLTRLRIGLSALARISSTISDQLSSFQESEAGFIFSIHQCPVCWGRKTDSPACHFSTGFLLASLQWFSGGLEFTVRQMTARSCGQENCTFEINKEPVRDDPAVE